tara:strand:- start:99 stop:200 length:102 start_codon:yes stop_codon:yes gene_type:complete
VAEVVMRPRRAVRIIVKGHVMPWPKREALVVEA